MDIPIDAEVVCSDGPGGRTTAVIVDPVKQQVTHVVVRERAFPHTEYLAPIELVTEATAETVHLRCSRSDLFGLAPLRHTEFITSDQPFGAYSPTQYLAWPYVTPYPMAVPLDYEQVPPGELAVHRGARVDASDGHVGRVDEFLVDPRNGHITHLVLREGHLWNKRDATIPLSAIDHLADDHVYLKLDKQAVAALPSVPVHRHQQ
jgi:hypothetical protein